MTQHTPGPWECVGFENLVVNDEEGNTITCAPGGRYGATLGELRANARLIAASPDLLLQLKLLVRWAEDQGEDCQLAKAAIAKAEGRG